MEYWNEHDNQYYEMLKDMEDYKMKDMTEGTPLKELTDDVKEIITNKNNIEIVCNGSASDEHPSTFIVFKHLVNTEKLFYISIILEDDVYDIDYDCNNGMYGTFGMFDDKYEDLDKLKTDINKFINDVNKQTEFSGTIMSLDINWVNRAFITYYLMCKIPTPPKLRGFVMF